MILPATYATRHRTQGSHRIVWSATCLLMPLLTAADLPAQAATGEKTNEAKNQWAFLIAVEGYEKATPLQFTSNDVGRLSETLRTRGQHQVFAMTDTLDEEDLHPRAQNLSEQIPKWLEKPKPGDSVILYFSGHGFKDAEGRLYLAPMDCDPADPAASGISVAWLRQQLSSCQAEFKLLILDACHAGAEKNARIAGVSAKELAAPFEDLADVATLASSGSDELSLIWQAKQQSLFSYWLNQGLQGHADSGGDGAISIDELFEYVHEQVIDTAKRQFGFSQTPVRNLPPGVLGVPVVVRLRPFTLKQVLDDMAEQLATAMQLRSLKKVGVLEFTADTKLRELEGTDFALLGQYCAEELEVRLLRRSGMKFEVMERGRLTQAFKGQEFDQVHTELLTKVANSVGGLPVIALGTLRSRQGRVVSLHCKLVDTTTHVAKGYAGGTAELNESEWAMLGRSVVVQPEDRPVPSDTTAEDEAGTFVAWDERSEGQHPMRDRRFPYQVKIQVRDPLTRKYTDRKATFDGNNMFVPLSSGEVYRIVVEHQEWLRKQHLLADDTQNEQKLVVRLLVDGLNTLPQWVPTKGIWVEGAPKKAYLPAQPVNLDEARFWVLRASEGPLFSFSGFYTKTGQDGEYREFKVVDAHKSLAARNKFHDQIGLITAAFYAPEPTSGERSVGTDMGDTRKVDATEQRGVEPGNLLAVVHIRYVDPETLENWAPN